MAQTRCYVADEAALLALAARCAPALAACRLVFLNGTLGAGKTTFARGILRALGHSGSVKTPTYTLVEPYEIAAKAVYHFDLYRLGEPEELEYMGVRDYLDEGALCLVEWPERARGMLGEPDISFDIQMLNQGREVLLRAHSSAGDACIRALAEET